MRCLKEYLRFVQANRHDKEAIFWEPGNFLQTESGGSFQVVSDVYFSWSGGKAAVKCSLLQDGYTYCPLYTPTTITLTLHLLSYSASHRFGCKDWGTESLHGTCIMSRLPWNIKGESQLWGGEAGSLTRAAVRYPTVERERVEGEVLQLAVWQYL